MNKLYSITELSKILKFKTKRPNESCIRLLKQLEEKKQIKILEKIGRQFFVSESILKNTLPQLFENDNMSESNILKLKETIYILSNKLNILTAKIQVLESKLDNLTRN